MTAPVFTGVEGGAVSQAFLLDVSPIVAGLVAVIAFYVGSIGSYRSEIAWDEETDFEDRRHLRQFIANSLGLLFTGATAVLALMVVLK